MMVCMSCGHTLFFIHVLVHATRPSVWNWFAYKRYRHRLSASSGSLEMSLRMKTRGFCAKLWSLAVAMVTRGRGGHGGARVQESGGRVAERSRRALENPLLRAAGRSRCYAACCSASSEV
jgi:hypothetical protein